MRQDPAPSLAVLITYYNEREMLQACLDSLLHASALPDEILIYDDASDYPAQDYLPATRTPIRVIRAPTNEGPGYGRNVLLNSSTSTYVHFQDADDLFHPTWCAKVRAALQEGVDILLTEVASIGDGQKGSQHVLGLERLLHGGDLIRFGLQGSILPAATTFRRTLGLQIGGYRTWDILPQAEDFDFHLRLAALGLRYAIILEPLITKRLHLTNHSRNEVECLTSLLRSLHLLVAELPRPYHTEMAETAARVASLLYKHGHLSEAQQGFRLAQSLGTPTYRGQSRGYRLLARTLGPLPAEWVGGLYRHLPASLRHRLRGSASPR